MLGGNEGPAAIGPAGPFAPSQFQMQMHQSQSAARQAEANWPGECRESHRATLLYIDVAAPKVDP